MVAHDAGVEVICPGCGQTVLQKAMIPLLADGGQGIGYLCPSCARGLVVHATVPGGDGPEPAEAAAAEPEPAAGPEPGN